MSISVAIENAKKQIGPITKEQTAAVDWLTVTAKSAACRRAIYDQAIRDIAAIKAEGNNIKTWNWKNYTGLQCKGYRWGTRPDSDIWVLSGDQANDYWPAALKLAENVTRIDLAVTVGLVAPETEFAWKIYLALQGQLNGKQRCKKFTYITNNDGGQTLYVGSRASDQFGRLYDKGRENVKKLDLEPGILWRYEVEFKNARAKRIAEQLSHLSCQPREIGNVLAATVQEWFFCRGVPTLLLKEPGDILGTSVAARVTDDQITLEWLSSQVRPSVKRLVEAGKEYAVRQALGISGIDSTEFS